MYRPYLRLKACPRCKGDILVDRATEDAEVCIQCGYRNFKGFIQPAHLQSLAGTREMVIKGQARRKVTEKSDSRIR
ncbi:hypothetical protein ACFLWW_02150 [Chloroflexota bacterium]